MSKKVNLKEQITIQLDMLAFVDQVARRHQIVYSLSAGTLLGAIRHHGMIPWDDDVDIMLKRDEYTRLLRELEIEIKGSHYALLTPDNLNTGNVQLPFTKLVDTRTRVKTNEPVRKEFGVFIDIFPLDKIPNDNQKFLAEVRKQQEEAIRSDFPAYTHALKYYITIIFAIIKFPKMMSLHKNGGIKQRLQVLNEYMVKYANLTTDYYYAYPADQYENLHFERTWLNETVDVQFENLSLMVFADYDKILNNYYGANYMNIPPVEEQVLRHTYRYVWR